MELTAGWPGGRITYQPRQVEGVAVGPDIVVVVQVRGRWGVTAEKLAGEARAAVVAGRRVDVVVADLEEPPPSGADVRSA